ncbi:hypothetical protein Pan241w_42210 [Gimesia alba]|uniref:Uncharacterized protein n=1 Tax=Gimesia alba TaxID=2527973 RepID=A0A517RJR0_9PLAN|nr:hypothetical protein [Gimesia alba]QDT44115.1 hypothetical protein Pan241w_42210 [Gimesia alba]
MVVPKQYHYVGPVEIKQRVLNSAVCPSVYSKQDLLQRLRELEFEFRPNQSLIVTYVIDTSGFLKITDRHNEHVICASGHNVFSAGEMTFGYHKQDCVIENITNQSTGYCPEPESWHAVQSALNHIGIEHPEYFEPAFHFRRCTHCGQTNLIKDNWFVCAVCENELPKDWNFDK